MYISPMRDAIDAGLQPTNHTDFVVAPLDQLFMLWSAVNRISRAGAEIGPDQRVTPLEGLKAMTIWAAEQYGEQGARARWNPASSPTWSSSTTIPLPRPHSDQRHQGRRNDQGGPNDLRAHERQEALKPPGYQAPSPIASASRCRHGPHQGPARRHLPRHAPADRPWRATDRGKGEAGPLHVPDPVRSRHDQSQASPTPSRPASKKTASSASSTISATRSSPAAPQRRSRWS